MAEEARIERLEDRVASLEMATAHGFGKLEMSIAALSELVRATIARPVETPRWVGLLAASALVLSVGTVLIAFVLLVK
jgi:hypothetical protein